MILLCTVCALAVLLLSLSFVLRRPDGGTLPRQRTALSSGSRLHRFHPPKPPWGHKEIVRLKALIPAVGCRRVADTFNRLHEARRGMTVGKTYLAGVIRAHGEEIVRLRRDIKHRRPRAMARNVIWALDWTWIGGPDGEAAPVLGVIDHGSRACLALQPVESQRTVALLRQLLDLFGRFGTPKVLRTDNDGPCRSLLLRAVLRLLGVRHQRTEPFAPWQNGRIERLFLTVKDVIRQRREQTGVAGVGPGDLARLRTWYNHLRPHQHLNGLTPAEAWNGKVPDRQRRPHWMSDGDGLLVGYY